MKCMFVADCNLSGGAERVISVLVNFLNEKGHDVVLLNFDKESNFYPINKGVYVIKLLKSYPQIENKNKIVKRLAIIKETRKEIGRIRPDVVIPFLFDAELATIPFCVMHRIPCITSVRNDADMYPKYQRLFRKIFYPLITAVVFQSAAVMNHKDYRNLRNSFVIPNPVSMKLIEERDLPIKKYKIISVGRLNNQKNHKMTIKAVKRLIDDYPEIELHIFGDGPLKKELKELINELGLYNSVFLDGVVENAQYVNRDAQAFVMASDYEGFPNALLEAMACHIPVICTNFNSGTAAEALNNGDAGWLIEVGDCDALETSLRNCFEDEAIAEKKAKKAINRCRSYDVNTIGNKWEELILNCVR